MYGLVNRCAQDFVLSRYGTDVWKEIAREADLPVAFVDMQSYPDSVTYGILISAAEKSGTPVADLLNMFGRHFITFSSHNGYDGLMSVMADNIGDFLANLNTMHTHVGETFPQDLRTPFFWVTDRTENSLILKYKPGLSSRKGLTTFVVGIVEGLSQRFTDVIITCKPILTAETNEADHECFHVTWIPSAQEGDRAAEAPGTDDTDSTPGTSGLGSASFKGNKGEESKDTSKSVSTLRVLYIAEDEAFSFELRGLEHELEASDTVSDLIEAAGNVAGIEHEDSTTNCDDTEPLSTAIKSGRNLVLLDDRRISIVRLDIPTAADLDKLDLS